MYDIPALIIFGFAFTAIMAYIDANLWITGIAAAIIGWYFSRLNRKNNKQNNNTEDKENND